MIYEGSYDTEDWSNDCWKFSFAITEMNYILNSQTHFHGKHNYNIIFSYYFIAIFYIWFWIESLIIHCWSHDFVLYNDHLLIISLF